MKDSKTPLFKRLSGRVMVSGATTQFHRTKGPNGVDNRCSDVFDFSELSVNDEQVSRAIHALILTTPLP